MKDLNYDVDEEETTKDVDEAVVKATILQPDGDEKDVKIKLEPMDTGGTNISIRVDLMGDEALSRKILQKIQDNLVTIE